MRRNQRNPSPFITYQRSRIDFLRKIPPARLLLFLHKKGTSTYDGDEVPNDETNIASSVSCLCLFRIKNKCLFLYVVDPASPL